MNIRIGSRRSPLAVAQSEWIKQKILEKYPDYTVEINTMSTEGDRRLDQSLVELGGKGLFTAELEQALRAGDIDLAVHSLKDMPQSSPQDLPVVAFSVREDVRDVLILPKGRAKADVRAIGTSSLRRSSQLKQLMPYAHCVPLRGNLQTRFDKLNRGACDAMVVALAGLKRLGMERIATEVFSIENMLPAAGQGILAVQGRLGDDVHYLQHVDDVFSRDAYAAESAFIQALEATCTSPVGAYATVCGDRLVLRAMVADGKLRARFGRIEGARDEARALGSALAARMQTVIKTEE